MTRGLRPTDDLRVFLDDGTSRATVKLVYEAVAQASRESRAYNKGIEGSLSRLEDLPVLVGQLVERSEGTGIRLVSIEGKLSDLQDIPVRVKALEDESKSKGEYRRVHLPTLALSVAGIALSVLGLLHAG